MKINKILKREAIITIILFLFYILWCYYFAFIYPPEDINDYKYILGFPDWFFYSCIMGYIIFNIIVFLVIKLVFKDINLEEKSNE